jgi:hypothetical protein
VYEAVGVLGSGLLGTPDSAIIPSGQFFRPCVGPKLDTES